MREREDVEFFIPLLLDSYPRSERLKEGMKRWEEIRCMGKKMNPRRKHERMMM